MTYLIYRDGQQYGPYTLDDVRQYCAQGRIAQSDFAWAEGMPEWVTVEKLLRMSSAQARQSTDTTSSQTPPGTPRQTLPDAARPSANKARMEVQGVRLRPREGKWFGIFAISLVLALVGVGFATDGETSRWMAWMGWFFAGFLALCALVSLIALFSDGSYLDLSREGFVVCSLFRRLPLIPWNAVSNFRAEWIPPARLVVFDAERDLRLHPRLAAFSKAAFGASNCLPDTYGRSAEELAALMNKWKRGNLPSR